eukprot:754408-Hanusia_phi.AAC.5
MFLLRCCVPLLPHLRLLHNAPVLSTSSHSSLPPLVLESDPAPTPAPAAAAAAATTTPLHKLRTRFVLPMIHFLVSFTSTCLSCYHLDFPFSKVHSQLHPEFQSSSSNTSAFIDLLALALMIVSAGAAGEQAGEQGRGDEELLPSSLHGNQAGGGRQGRGGRRRAYRLQVRTERQGQEGAPAEAEGGKGCDGEEAAGGGEGGDEGLGGPKGGGGQEHSKAAGAAGHAGEGHQARRELPLPRARRPVPSAAGFSARAAGEGGGEVGRRG